MRRLGTWLTIAALPLVAGVARGDTEETERRLKSAGVDAALRTKIHGSIDRGVAFLVKRQQTDGSFEERARSDTPDVYSTRGVTLLCALALRHAATAPTEPAVRKAIGALHLDDAKAVSEIEKHVYEAGLAMMLFAAVPGHEKAARRVATALARGLDESSRIWGYDTPGSGDDTRTEPTVSSARRTPNISTAQFAALGLAAARRMEIPVPATVWIRHAEGLCSLQRANGSWLYGLDKTPNQATTFANTYMGLANLLLADAALRSAKDVPADLMARLAKAIEKARRSLARGAARTLANPRSLVANIDDDKLPDIGLGSLPEVGGPAEAGLALPGIGAFYTLYALEKACLFGDIESIDVPDAPAKNAKPGAKPRTKKLFWYPTGAKWLLAAQRADGGWSPSSRARDDDGSSEIDTAFALLFLLRSPSVFHPTTPTEVDAKPRGAVTESDSTPPSK